MGGWVALLITSHLSLATVFVDPTVCEEASAKGPKEQGLTKTSGKN